MIHISVNLLLTCCFALS